MQDRIICKNCGAEIYWSPDTDSLKCEYCDTEYQPSDFYNENPDTAKASYQAIDDAMKEAALHMASADDDSVSKDLTAYQCTYCKATLVTAKSTIATTCPYCGKSLTITEKLVGDKLPGKVAPFKVNKENALELFDVYARRSFLTPGNFRQKRIIEKIKGVYIPFWLFNIDNEAQAKLNCSNSIHVKQGNDRVTTISKYAVDITVLADFINLPSDALTHMSDELMDAIEPFDYDDMRDFNSGFLAGFYTEEYDIGQKDNLERVITRVQNATKEQIRKESGTYQVKTIAAYRSRQHNVKATYALLPVWLINIDYLGKKYIYAINGQTGKIAGKLPMSVGRESIAFALGSAGGLVASPIVMYIITALLGG